MRFLLTGSHSFVGSTFVSALFKTETKNERTILFRLKIQLKSYG